MLVWRCSPVTNEEVGPSCPDCCSTGAAAGERAGAGEETGAGVSEVAAGASAGVGPTGFDWLVLAGGAGVGLGWRKIDQCYMMDMVIRSAPWIP